MDGDGETGSIKSAPNLTIRIAHAVFEVRAVDQQAQSLLETANYVDRSLRIAGTLRRQRSTELASLEKEWIDEVFANAESAIQKVAALVDPARIDLGEKSSTANADQNKDTFVLSNSPTVGTNLSRLSIVSQSLNTTMEILCNRQGKPPLNPELTAKSIDQSRAPNKHSMLEHSVSSASSEKQQPPAYEDILPPADTKYDIVASVKKSGQAMEDISAQINSFRMSPLAFCRVIPARKQVGSPPTQPVVEEKQVYSGASIIDDGLIPVESEQFGKGSASTSTSPVGNYLRYTLDRADGSLVSLPDVLGTQQDRPLSQQPRYYHSRPSSTASLQSSLQCHSPPAPARATSSYQGEIGHSQSLPPDSQVMPARAQRSTSSPLSPPLFCDSDAPEAVVQPQQRPPFAHFGSRPQSSESLERKHILLSHSVTVPSYTMAGHPPSTFISNSTSLQNLHHAPSHPLLPTWEASMDSDKEITVQSHPPQTQVQRPQPWSPDDITSLSDTRPKIKGRDRRDAWLQYQAACRHSTY